jgi:CheY-like chemotaxis protein
MNAIVGMTELMLTTKLNDEQKSQALAVKGAAMSLLTIINDILDFSKLSADKMEIIAVPFDIASLINDTLNIVSMKAAAAGLSLTASVSKDIPPQVNGDEVRIKQCLLNLLNNAVKFTSEGSVSLSVTCEHLDAGLKLSFAVRDTGLGIQKEEIAKLFDAFSQLDTKKNRKIVGTGLGLAITKSLIEMMGGRISVDSVYGEGSVFSFYVMCAGRHGGTLAELPNPESYRVLVYEPNKHHSLAMGDMLRELGVRFDICVNAPAFEEKIADGYTHVFYDKSAAGRVQELRNPSVEYVAMKEIQDTNIQIASVNRPLLITVLVRCLNGGGEDENIASREEITLGAFQTKDVLVLLVDDNPVNLLVAEGMLRQYGISVETAANGLEGLEKIQEKEYDAAFFDHMMPVMDGVEAVSHIRALGGRYARMPIVALTANVLAGADKVFYEAGMDGVLAKPIIIRELHRTLIQFLPPEKII